MDFTGLDPEDVSVAKGFDEADPLRQLRDEFHIPSVRDILEGEAAAKVEAGADADRRCIYFCGNSLGLQPRSVQRLVSEELSVWAAKGVNGHYSHPHSRPWVTIDETVTAYMADVVGAELPEVAVMGTLTSNLHILMASFYKPTKEKYKIIIESKAFPSDHYAVESQLIVNGYDPADALVAIEPKPGTTHLTTEQILETIELHKDKACLVLLPGVQYYTGQAFDIERITEFSHSRGLLAGWDLAHAAGNVVLKLHDWKVDFATWCSYKYLNSGPGGISGIFVHEAHEQRPRLSGWWGHDKASRFLMNNVFKPIPGAGGWQLSNPSVISTVCLLGSLELFAKATMSGIREKSLKITGYLEYLLDTVDFGSKPRPFEVITPRDPKDRGAQLSLKFGEGVMEKVLERLQAKGVIVDERKPDVIRVAPAPLYNTFEDVWIFTRILKDALESVV